MSDSDPYREWGTIVVMPRDGQRCGLLAKRATRKCRQPPGWWARKVFALIGRRVIAGSLWRCPVCGDVYEAAGYYDARVESSAFSFAHWIHWVRVPLSRWLESGGAE